MPLQGLLPESDITLHMLLPDDEDLAALAFDKISRMVRKRRKWACAADLEDAISAVYLDILSSSTANLDKVMNQIWDDLDDMPHAPAFASVGELVERVQDDLADVRENAGTPSPFLSHLAKAGYLSHDGLFWQRGDWTLKDKVRKDDPVGQRLKSNLKHVLVELVGAGKLRCDAEKVTFGSEFRVAGHQKSEMTLSAVLMGADEPFRSLDDLRMFGEGGKAAKASVHAYIDRLLDAGLTRFSISDLFESLVDDVRTAQVSKGRAAVQQEGARPILTQTALAEHAESESPRFTRNISPDVRLDDQEFLDRLVECIKCRLDQALQKRLDVLQKKQQGDRQQQPEGGTLPQSDFNADPQVARLRRIRKSLDLRLKRFQQCIHDGVDLPSDAQLAREQGIPTATYHDDMNRLRTLEQECISKLDPGNNLGS